MARRKKSRVRHLAEHRSELVTVWDIYLVVREMFAPWCDDAILGINLEVDFNDFTNICLGGEAEIEVYGDVISIYRYDDEGNFFLARTIDLKQLIIDALKPELQYREGMEVDGGAA